jgi:hypothetical protein
MKILLIRPAVYSADNPEEVLEAERIIARKLSRFRKALLSEGVVTLITYRKVDRKKPFNELELEVVEV